ncbi:MAG: amino-acid N-acetyltransferase [Succinivibrionaceae bacterium]|nr:amino-acid N-acetyltransferase [Ruminobacter sp.]MDY5780139.1 amino-acid N-acetyltransferase [Succinivibrionaceae bacterium]MEE1340493.1 amino-acid N-acetyltransferase [Succinivibrionaceae bacterium]
MNRTTDSNLVQAFRHSGPYLKHHRGSTFVIMLPGTTVASPFFDDIISDLALLQSLGIKLVLVFGAREQIDDELKKFNITAKFHKRIRIADDETFAVIKRVCGYMQIDLTSKLSMGLINTPMQGSRLNVVTGNFITARPLGVCDGIDYIHSGIVRRVDAENITRELANNSIVLISPVGYSVSGESFSVNSEDIAAQVAIAIKADKLITFCSDDELILDENGEVIAELFPDQAMEYLDKIDEEIHNSTCRYLRASITSCHGGVERCHLVSHEQSGSIIQELFTRDGIGTQIVSQSAEQVSQATINDIPSLMELIRPLELEGILVHRPREQLEMEIDHYVVIKRDGMVIASAALYCYDDEKMAELACVAIHPRYRGANRGNILINKVEELALKKGIKTLFVLTTKSAHFFLEKGFIPGDINDLPKKKREHYNYQRMSKVLLRPIAQN